MMTYKWQLSPISGARESNSRTAWDLWDDPTADSRNARFFHSWLVYDYDLELIPTQGSINWNKVMGLGLATVVSASFWVGVGLAVAHIWQ